MNSAVLGGRGVEQPGPLTAAQGKRHLLIINPPPTDLGGRPLLPDFPWPSRTGLVYEPTASFELKRVYSEVLEFALLEGGNRQFEGRCRSRSHSLHSFYEEAGGARTALRK